MLKARVEDNPVTWDEHLDFCMMAYRSRVHSSTGHTPFELMFVREMRKPLDVMVGGAEDNECSYTDFITDLEEDLQTAYRDVRQNLEVAQRRQKDAYDKGVKHTVYQLGDLVLRYTPQLKPEEGQTVTGALRDCNAGHRSYPSGQESSRTLKEVQSSPFQ